ncbi:sugar-binding transcriptional regulator [Mammaliicoccus lentus]|uniref:sugar-binding transcriptional regulator n=1 Tax=Mammaliicoccus lentus TaxID=42858 RepID=UPI003CEBE7B2
MNDKEYKIIRVAELYYKQGYSQQEIANILSVSRASVSRLINDSKNRGIVEIKINTPYSIDYVLSTKIKEQFGLKDAIVVDIDDEDETITLSKVGKVAANFLMSILENDSILGVSFGKHIKYVVESIPENQFEHIEVVQLVGGLGSGDSNIDGPSLAMNLGDKLHGKSKYINSPAVVHSKEIKEALVNQSQISQVFDVIAKCNFAIHGIGSLDEYNSSMQRSGYIDDSSIDELKNLNVVGHVLGNMIDIEGNNIRKENYYTIGAPLKTLKKLKWSIGVATNPLKYKAVLGAINGKYINCLIINRTLAKKLLNN